MENDDKVEHGEAEQKRRPLLEPQEGFMTKGFKDSENQGRSGKPET
jgi:hypothetical protein